MNDGIIKNDGTSRLMRASLPATYEEFKKACEAGTQPLDVLFNEEGWMQLPDFLNKGNLWSDVTEALFGLGVDSVPNDGFAYLGKYAQHWWRRRVNTTDPIYVEKQSSASPNVSQVTPYLCLLNPNGPTSGSVTYADTVYVNLSTGEVSLVNAKQVSFDYYNDAVGQSFKGKYVTGLYNAPNNIYFITKDAVYNRSGWADYFVIGYDISSVKIVTSELDQNPTIGEWVYLQSSDRSAYPTSGEQDGYEYQYIGIPFDNAVGAPTVESGSYIGTGKKGKNNPNSLSFNKKPAIVFIQGFFGSPNTSSNGILVLMESGGYFFRTGDDISSVEIASWGETISWYQATDDSNYPGSSQGNVSGKTYNYIALA